MFLSSQISTVDPPTPTADLTQQHAIADILNGNSLDTTGDAQHDLFLHLRFLSVAHRHEFLAHRAARWHRLFALLCFMLFIVVRLWILAIYTNDYPLMFFCSLVTAATLNIWRRGRAENMERDNAIVNNLRDLVRDLDLVGRSVIEQIPLEGVLTNETKSSWERFSWGARRNRVVPCPPSASPSPDIENNIESTPSGSFTPRTALDEQQTCSICLCEYEADDEIVRLPCYHLYHNECLAEWVGNHVRCPLCNLDLGADAPDLNV